MIYLQDINQVRFLEIVNNFSVDTKYIVYFTGEYDTLFLEGNSAVNYNSLENGYTVEIEKNSKVYLEIQNSSSFLERKCKVYFVSLDGKDVQQEEIVSCPYKPNYQKKVGVFKNYPKPFDSKEDDESFGLYNTLPSISGNFKITIDSEEKVFVSMFPTEGIVDEKLYRYITKENSNYAKDLHEMVGKNSISNELFYKDLERDISFDTKIDLKYQYKNLYKYGCSVYPTKLYDEKYSFFSPLYLKKNIPSKFIIFKKKDILIKDEDLLKDLEIHKVYDLSENSSLGKYIRNLKELTYYEREPLYMDTYTGYLSVTGIDIKTGTIATVYENMSSFIENEQTVTDVEKHIASVYTKNNMVSHRVLNLEFLFDLEENDSDISTFFGMYADDIELQKLSIDEEALGKIYGDSVSFYSNSFIKGNRLYHKENINASSINDGKRILYVKDTKGKLYNVKEKGEEYQQHKYLELDRNFDYNNMVCVSGGSGDNFFYKTSKDYIKENFSFTVISLENITEGDFFRIDYKDKTYTYVADDTMFSEEYTRVRTEESYNISKTYPFTINEEYGYLETEQDDDIFSGYVVTINGKQYEVTDITRGTENNLYLEGDITEDGTLSYSINQGKISYFRTAENLKDSLYSLEQTINQDLDLPFMVYVSEKLLYLCSKSKVKQDNDFKVLFNSEKGSGKIDGNKSYKTFKFKGGLSKNENSLTITEKEKNIISENTKIISPYGVFPISKYGEDLTIPSINSLGNYNIKFKGDIPFNESKVMVADYCKLSFGIFSFYDIKAIDTDMVVSQNDSVITNEYKRFFGNFRDGDTLHNNQVYRVYNASDKSLNLFLYYKKKGKFEDSENELLNIIVNPNGHYDFDTYYTNYGLEEGDFYIRNTVNYEDYYVVPLSFFEDPESFNFTEFKILQNITTQNVIDIKENLKSKYREESKTISNIKSEYDRLREKDIEGYHTKVFKNQVPKWSMVKSTDSYGNPYRLNFNRVFGKTNMCVYPFDYTTPENLNYNWFYIDETLYDTNITNESSKLYGFGKIEPSKLISNSYDYFTEYFTTGFPQVYKDGKYIPFTINELYTKLEKIREGLYECTYKGAKYNFYSENDISDYKFAIVATFNPEKETLDNTNIVSDKHCCEDPVSIPDGCNVKGFFKPLSDAIARINQGEDTTLNITYSFVTSANLNFEDFEDVPCTNIASISTGFIDFRNSLEEGFTEWKVMLESLYSTSNDCKANLTVNFTDLGVETSAVDIEDEGISDYSTIQSSNIGMLRIAYAPLEQDVLAYTKYTSAYIGEYYNETAIIFSDKVTWRTETDTREGYSIKLTAAHELGHIFGLGHTTQVNSIMKNVLSSGLKYSLLYPSRIQKNIDGECLKKIYGFETVSEESESEVVTLSKSGEYHHYPKDNIQYIVNKKYKTITLLLSNYVSTYSAKGRKYGYTDVYIASKPKFWKHSETYSLEPEDIRTRSGLNFSSSGCTSKHNDIEIKPALNYDVQDEFGYATENSFYRLRSNIANLQISEGILEYSSEQVVLKPLYDTVGVKLKKTVTEVGSSLKETKIPFGKTKDFEESSLYRIRSNYNENVMYTLDFKYYIDRLNKKDIPFTVVSENGTVTNERFFEKNYIYPYTLTQKTAKTLKIENENDKIRVKLEQQESPFMFVRYSGNYDIMTKKIISFDLRDDIGKDYNIDLYRNNTSFSFSLLGKMYEHVQKISTKNILNEDINPNEVYPISNQTPINFKNISFVSSPLDEDYYDLYEGPDTFKGISGINDFFIKKGGFKNLVFKLPETIEVRATLTNKIEGRNMTVSFNKNDSLSEGLKIIYSQFLENLYNLADSKKLIYTEEIIKEKFLKNNIIPYYEFSEYKVYQRDSKVGSYTNHTEGLINNIDFSKKEENVTLSWDTKTTSPVEYNIILTYKFI